MSTERTPRRRVAVLALVTSLAALLTACTIDRGTDAAPSPPTPTTTIDTTAPVGGPPSAPPATGSATDPTAGLRSSFDTFATSLAGTVGMGVAAVDSATATTYGAWTNGVAWSTIKVPLAIAATDVDPGAASTPASAAITRSDNASAEQLWALLGDPEQAAQQVQSVLTAGGDTLTQVQSRRIRPEYTAFGQTQWSVQQQTLFTAHLPCLPTASSVTSLMKNLTPDQRWGLARIDGAATKAGWGPDSNGRYLVRQLAVLPTPTGQVAVTLAALPNAGTFDAGIGLLDRMSTWVREHLDQLPAGTCR